jgi:hypothetical protein
MRFAANHVDLLLKKVTISQKKNMTEKRKDGRLFYLSASKNFQSFTIICLKPRMASSICLRATIFKTPN